MEYRITIGQREETVDIVESEGYYDVTFGGRTHRVDVQTLEPGSILSMLVDGRSHEAELLRVEDGYEVVLPTRSFQVGVQDELLARAGRRPTATVATGKSTIVSPMPGVVVDIKVAVGDTVAAGDAVVVVEAMKMQNEFPAPTAGVVTEVHATAGDTVAAGAALVTLEAGASG